jgi:hypothetical protein
MNRFFYNPAWARPLFIELRCCQSISQSGPTQSHTTTGTTSGQASPVAAEGSQSTGSGSIGVAGQNARYIESGGTDNANADQSTRINSGSGSTIYLGDPNAGQVISQLAQTVASTAPAGGGGGSSTPLVLPLTQAAAAVPWTTIGILGGVVLLIVFIFRRKS